jgi:hypothetical protein
MRRSLYFLLAFVLLFTLAVIIYIFFFSKSAPVSSKPDPKDPFGRASERVRVFIPSFGRETTATSSETEVIPAEDQLLNKIWDKPVAGFAFIDRPILEQVASTTVVGSSSLPSVSQIRATSTSLLFVDRTTGYVYEYIHKNLKLHQVSNTRSPGVYDALFLGNGSFVVLRMFDEAKGVIVSTVYKVPVTALSADPTPLEKLFTLPNNVTSFAVSESGRLFSYLVKTKTGSMLYTVRTDLPTFEPSSTTLYFSEWTLFYGGEMLYMTQKASAFATGYTVEVFTGKRLVNDKTGLISLGSEDEDNLISSMNSQKGLATFLFNKKTATTSILPIKTIASKCTFEKSYPSVICGVPTFIPKSVYGLPDDWYQGVVSFSDTLYRFSNDGNTGGVIIDLKKQSGEDLDIIKLHTNSSDSYLSFINKKDGSLWLANISLLAGD